MAQFSYKAMRESGESYTGTADAADRYALARKLKQSGDTLISAEEVGEGKGAPGVLKQWLKKVNTALGRVKLREKIMFARNLSAMLSAGLSLSRALSVLERQTNNKKFKKVLSAVGASVQKGNALSVSLEEFSGVFPPIFVAMVRAGEESGKLSESLTNIAIQMKKVYDLRRRIRGAMIYPSIIITAMILVGIVLMIVVVPTLTSTFEELDVDLPISTQIIIGISNFMKDNTAVFLGVLALVVGGLIWWFRQPAGKRVLEWTLLRLPVIKELVKQTNAAQMARTFSSLLVAGVEVVGAVGITKEVVQNSYFRAVLVEAEEKIPKGDTIATAFLAHEELYPPLVGEMISVGEEAGNLPEMLERVAEFYEGEVEERTKNLSTIIEPILMIIIGSVVGFFALSMISPIYSLSNAI